MDPKMPVGEQKVTPPERDPHRVAREITTLADTYSIKQAPSARHLRALIIDELQKLSPSSRQLAAKEIRGNSKFSDYLSAWDPGAPKENSSEPSEQRQLHEAIQEIVRILKENPN
ncbi:hypothetical protein HZA86_02635 [Candidatus Uhrbacteria bacterium]|nr:hypothetical protein [Candidatus Uhrbacteria bacterium]